MNKKEYDPTKTKYKLMLLAPGDNLILNNIVEDASWSEEEGTCMGSLKLTLAQVYNEERNFWTDGLLLNGTKIKLYADQELINIYQVIENSLTVSADGRHVQVTAYDRFWNLSNSEESYHYDKGLSTLQIVGDLFMRAETKLEYNYENIVHEEIWTKSQTMMDEIADVLEQAYLKAGKFKPVVLMEGDHARITNRGWNQSDIYTFYSYNDARQSDKGNIISFDRSRSVDNLITRVQMRAANDKDEPVIDLGHIDGEHIGFAILTKDMVSSGQNSWDLKREAKKELAEHGREEVTYKITTPDVPFVRKGHKIKVIISGATRAYYYVKSVTHNIKDRTMSMVIEAEGDEVKMNTELEPAELQAEQDWLKKQEEAKNAGK